MKKILTLLLSLAMLFAFSVPSYAASTTSVAKNTKCKIISTKISDYGVVSMKWTNSSKVAYYKLKLSSKERDLELKFSNTKGFKEFKKLNLDVNLYYHFSYRDDVTLSITPYTKVNKKFIKGKTTTKKFAFKIKNQEIALELVPDIKIDINFESLPAGFYLEQTSKQKNVDGYRIYEVFAGNLDDDIRKLVTDSPWFRKTIYSNLKYYYWEIRPYKIVAEKEIYSFNAIAITPDGKTELIRGSNIEAHLNKAPEQEKEN